MILIKCFILWIYLYSLLFQSLKAVPSEEIYSLPHLLQEMNWEDNEEFRLGFENLIHSIHHYQKSKEPCTWEGTPQSLPCLLPYLMEKKETALKASSLKKQSLKNIPLDLFKQYTVEENLTLTKKYTLSFNAYSKNVSLFLKKPCENIHPLLALQIHGESFFPKIAAHDLNTKIYQDLDKCIPSDHAYYERFHQRYGLTQIALSSPGSTLIGIQSLEKSLLSSKPKEQFRSFYWLGKLTNNPKYWESLGILHPLSYHWVLASEEMKVPLTQWLPEKTNYRQRGLSEKDNLSLWLVELLISKNSYKSSQEVLKMIYSSLPMEDKSLYLHLSKLSHSLNSPRLSILFLNRYLRNHHKIGKDSLHLLFPVAHKTALESFDSLDIPFTLGLMRQESAFDSEITSPAKAIGLMQVLPKTAKTLWPHIKDEVTTLKNPFMNIALGTAYLKQTSDFYNHSLPLVLSSYNAGPHKVRKWVSRWPHLKDELLFSDMIPYFETRHYVSTVLRNAHWYQTIIDGYSP
jgi:hypothetical protein